ncbi:phosphoenolpyruvate hydrolase family protein [Jiangella asiatica]|uniref:Phosphoenolpyruvate hydrolase family protein n=1 Tax=Jiangella asiatica TaxID=2530372 RepID=A0A4R5D415_9ACTN|nr:phosphoenolpyruvate hydrolase family protein [Jiangella asiatica]TDE08006.1 phosphoenolpyruvate hydrolase family protein [Jiangella asiatica]
MTQATRVEILDGFRKKINTGRPVVGGGAGVGLSAKCAELAGLDFIVIYNSGRYRMAGRSSMAGLMPYGDANAIVMEMADEVLPVVRHTPVVAGVCGTDPFRSIPRLLDDVRSRGFAGVQNYPTVCLFEGIIRANLEETGLGFDREVDMVRLARERDLLTLSYVASPDEARAMVDAGADILVPHMGLTTSGTVGARTAISMAEVLDRLAEMRDAIVREDPDAIVICHGGPIAEPDDVDLVLRKVPGVHGFLGASSMERLPTEVAMVDHMRRFLDIQLNG